MARSLGLMPFKDVFRADPDVAGDNGEPEALLSSLSTGPVGLGDRVGRMDPSLALRTCRGDGTLIKPDVPVAATATSMLANPAFNPELLVAECHSDHPAGRWMYVVTANSYPGDDPIRGEIPLRDLVGDGGDSMVWDWRRGRVEQVDADAGVELGREEWDYRVVAPVLAAGRLVVFGDVSKFVTAGDARIEVAETSWGVAITVKGAGETVSLTGWSDEPITAVGGDVAARDAESGVWRVDVAVGA